MGTHLGQSQGLCLLMMALDVQGLWIHGAWVISTELSALMSCGSTALARQTPIASFPAHSHHRQLGMLDRRPRTTRKID
jgi:hypothetical protein